MEKPRYQHDCNRCVFLGKNGEHDLYVCAKDMVIETIIARYSSNGPDYCSGLLFGVENLIPELTDALAKSLMLGYTLSVEDR